MHRCECGICNNKCNLCQNYGCGMCNFCKKHNIPTCKGCANAYQNYLAKFNAGVNANANMGININFMNLLSILFIAFVAYSMLKK